MSNLTQKIILIDDLDCFLKYFEKEKEINEFLLKIVTEYRSLKVALVVSGTEDNYKSYLYTVDFVKKLKDEQVGFVFEPLNSQRHFDVQLKYSQVEKPFEKGDAYFVNKSKFLRIKTLFIENGKNINKDIDEK